MEGKIKNKFKEKWRTKKFHLFTSHRPVCCPRIRGKKKSPLGNFSHAEAGHFRGKQTSLFTLSDSFSMEATQVYKLKVTLLSLLPNHQSHMRYISKGGAMVVCDVISSVAMVMCDVISSVAMVMCDVISCCYGHVWRCYGHVWLWQYCLLVTAILLYMFRTLSASIIRSTKTVVAVTGACHGSGWYISSKDVQGRLPLHYVIAGTTSQPVLNRLWHSAIRYRGFCPQL